MRSSRSLRVVLGTLVVASVVLSASPAVAGIPAGRYAIGDSVMLGARDDLIARGFRVNAQVSRQFRDVVPLVRELAAGGHLPENVIVHLGTNGAIDGADCDRLVRVAGPDRRIFLVTVKVPRPVSRPEQRAPQRVCAPPRQRLHHRLVRRSAGTTSGGSTATGITCDRSAATHTRRSSTGASEAPARAEAERDRPLDSFRWPARAAEGTRLESAWGGNSPEGSNPSATAREAQRSIARCV